MYNIQKAVSRLPFAPKLKEIEITDIQRGVGVFTPKTGQPVSFVALRSALEKAGYKLASARITIAGKLVRDEGGGGGWFIVAEGSGQRFALEGATLAAFVAERSAGASLELTGEWKTVGEKDAAREVVTLSDIKKDAVKDAKKSARRARDDDSSMHDADSPARFVMASFERAPVPVVPPEVTSPAPLAPIRTTSPGLTVFQGGAVIPRFFVSRQHLGSLEVTRQTLQLSVSYTPTPTLQLEAEIPYTRTAFRDGAQSGSTHGFGNATLWAKHRFFRQVERWGDRQSAVRVGLELPTGTGDAPTASQLDAPAFARQQLTPASGGFAAHFDGAFSQAKGRVIFGANVEATLRSERDGFRMGHELRTNTDLEYVLFPFSYRRPTKELFVILETHLVRRGGGRVEGFEVIDSRSTAFSVSPGLQYVATTRTVFETSVQIPVARTSGTQTLRDNYNVLLGVRYLF